MNNSQYFYLPTRRVSVQRVGHKDTVSCQCRCSRYLAPVVPILSAAFVCAKRVPRAIFTRKQLYVPILIIRAGHLAAFAQVPTHLLQYHS